MSVGDAIVLIVIFAFPLVLIASFVWGVRRESRPQRRARKAARRARRLSPESR